MPHGSARVAVAGDVNDDGDLERAVTTAVEQLGGLDVLVWNGGGPPPGTARDADEGLARIRLSAPPASRGDAGPPLPRAPRAQPRRPDRRDHVARGPGAHHAPCALQHVPPGAHGLAEDPQPGGRARRASPSTASRRAGSRRRGSTSSTRTARPTRSSRRSPSGAGERRGSSETSSASSPPTARATSPARLSSSTAA